MEDIKNKFRYILRLNAIIFLLAKKRILHESSNRVLFIMYSSIRLGR